MDASVCHTAAGRVEKFGDEDWDDWKYEHSQEAIERGRLARKQYARGEYLSLEQVKREYGLTTGGKD